MSNLVFDQDELEHLVSELFDADEKDPQKLARLEAILEASPEARAEYAKLTSLHTTLRFSIRSDSLVDLPSPKTSPVEKQVRINPLVSWSIAIGLLVTACLGSLFWMSQDTPIAHNDVLTEDVPVKSDPSDNTTDSQVADAADETPIFVARITQQSGARWKDDETLSIGSLLSNRRLTLIHGDARFTLDNGVEVTIQAPVSITINSLLSATLHSGRAWADVPQAAIGFTIDTPSASVEDLGTRFAVEVLDTGDSDIVVLDGEVRVATPGEGEMPPRVLKVNEAVRVRATESTLQDIPAPEALMREWTPEEYSASQPTTYYHWPFEKPSDESPDVWEEVASRPDSKSFPAVRTSTPGFKDPVVRPLKGVFGDAVFLNGQGDFLQTELPGITGDNPRTLCFWMRVPEQIGPRYAYSMVSWGNWRKPGGKWGVSWNSHKLGEFGVMGAIRTETQGGQLVGSTDLRDRQWHHIAVVYLGGTDEQSYGEIRNRIRLYVDGKLEPLSHYHNGIVETLNDEFSNKVRFGKYLGERQTDNFFKSYFGSLDEMYLFDGALTPKQIELLRTENTPPDTSQIVPVLHAN